jgi:hypothetical protein
MQRRAISGEELAELRVGGQVAACGECVQAVNPPYSAVSITELALVSSGATWS